MLSSEERIKSYKQAMYEPRVLRHFVYKYDLLKCTKCTEPGNCLNYELLEAYESQLKLFISQFTYLGLERLYMYKPVYWLADNGDITQTTIVGIDAVNGEVVVTVSSPLGDVTVSPRDLFPTEEDAFATKKVRQVLFDARLLRDRSAQIEFTQKYKRHPDWEFIASTISKLYNIQLKQFEQS